MTDPATKMRRRFAAAFVSGTFVMRLDFAALDFASWDRRPTPPAKATPARLRNLWQDLFDGYRPEQHYMRGPGPRAHAKRTLVAGISGSHR
jgi:hypothetical protein